MSPAPESTVAPRGAAHPDPGVAQDPAPRSSGYLLALGLASFASSAALRLCDAMLPALTHDFDVPLATAAWTISVYALAYGLLQMVYGTLGDRHGKWRLVTLTCLASTVGNTLAALAPGIGWLIFARGLSGATAAAIIPLSMALIGDRVPQAQRQVVLARYISATITGMIVGQWLSGTLADTVGWRWTFALFALLFAAIGLHMRVNHGGEWQVPAATGPRPAFVAGVIEVMGTGHARGVLLATVLLSVLAFGAVTFVPAFLHADFGLSLRAAAAVVVLYGVGGLLYAWVLAEWAHRLGRVRLLALGGLLAALSYASLVLAPHWAWTLPGCLGAGMAYYAMQNLLNMEATLITPHLRGTALSVFAASLFGGIALGVSLAAAVISRYGYRPVFAGAGLGLLVLGCLYGRSLAQWSTPAQRAASSR